MRPQEDCSLCVSPAQSNWCVVFGVAPSGSPQSWSAQKSADSAACADALERLPLRGYLSWSTSVLAMSCKGVWRCMLTGSHAMISSC